MAKLSGWSGFAAACARLMPGRRQGGAEPRASYPPLDERTAIYAVGDIHGRSDLLGDLHASIDRDVAAEPHKQHIEVYLGDYIDRGPDSVGVLQRLVSRARRRSVRVLMGNHEATLIDLVEGKIDGRAWLQFGGDATARSFGVDIRGAPDLAGAMRSAVPPALIDYLRALPVSYRFGPYFFAHAGVAPGVSLDRQSPEHLLWIRDRFLNHSGDFGAVVVHGHTPTTLPDFRRNRINIDTGAYATGVLTCLKISSSGASVLEAPRSN